MSREKILSVLRGALYVSAGAALTYLAHWLTSADVGVYAPLATAAAALLVKAAHLFSSPDGEPVEAKEEPK
jgi:hypothetical protein